MKEQLKTWSEWAQEKYCVIRGEKATWVNGEAKFSASQVTRKAPKDFALERGDEFSCGADSEGHWGGGDFWI